MAKLAKRRLEAADPSSPGIGLELGSGSTGGGEVLRTQSREQRGEVECQCTES